MIQSGGLIYQMEYDQFWEWMEYNRLQTFTREREDWRAAQLLSKLHNVNVSKESQLTTPKDFMPRSIDEIIEEEIAQEETMSNLEDSHQAAVTNFNQYVEHLKTIGKPINEQTIKV